MHKRKLRENFPELAAELKLIYKHVDTRLHGYIFRKCEPGSYACDHCKEHPTRSSKDFWKYLPKKKSGGLFYDCEVDPDLPGHYRTLLDLMGKVKDIEIKPDSMFADVDRCKVKYCYCSFKSQA